MEDDVFSEAEDSSEGEEDHVENHLENTDTKQEMSSEEDEYVMEPSANTVLGKDGTRWKLQLPVQNVRTRSHNIVTHLPGVKGAARNAKTVLSCWSAFFDDEMLNIIVGNTNKYISSKKDSYSRDRDCRTTDVSEIKAFIGLLYMAGFHRNSRLNTADFWATDGSGIELFRTTMSRNRFHFLMQFVRFDDKETREERKVYDKLAPIRDIVDRFVTHCQTNYSLGEYVTIDEMLPAFRGKCSFRQYIPSKPSKYGIKILALVDAKMFYTANLEIYVGVQPDGPYAVDNSAISVVKRLCTILSGSGRNITGDNWFTSQALVIDLLINHRLTYVGTVRKNKPQLPPSLVSVRNREVYSSKFVYQENLTFVSYIPKKGKNVLLFSSMHHDAAIDPETGEKKKPDIVTFYNGTKSGVDVVDKLCATYSVSRNTNRWPMALFYAMLNIAAINAYVIYKGNRNPVIADRRKFIKTLALELTVDHIKNRSKVSCLPKELQKRTREMVSAIEGNDAGEGSSKKAKIETSGTRRRCYICGRKKNRMTKYTCIKCENYICMEHANYICDFCNSDSD